MNNQRLVTSNLNDNSNELHMHISQLEKDRQYLIMQVQDTKTEMQIMQ